MRTKYKGYFRSHYGATFSEAEVALYRRWFYAQLRFFKEKLKGDPFGNQSMLEIGSGTGGFYSFLGKDERARYTGLEVDSDAVRFTNELFPQGKFINLSLQDFNSDGKFDRIFAFEVLEHIENPISAVDKIFSLLSPGGVFVGTSPFPFKKNVLADETHLFVLHPENWRRLFLESGFKKVEVYPMSFFPYIWRFSSWLNIRIPWYIPWTGFISTTLIIARKS